MRFSPAPALLFAVCAFSISASPDHLESQEFERWRAHDRSRPKPVVVTPAAVVGDAPGDAIVLFDGTDLSEWTSNNDAEPGWILGDGYVETVAGRGPLVTRRAFGDMQLHIEWAAPVVPVGEGQGRGNSGVIIMGRYEVQVLDSYGNSTYADGQAAAVYGQFPPLFNVSRGPGEWQSYDIVFRRPRFTESGDVAARARMTVFHNGVLVQDNVELWGATNWLEYRAYVSHEDALPLVLQDHSNPVRYRNIWVRELSDPVAATDLASAVSVFEPSRAKLESYVGSWGTAESSPVAISLEGSQLHLTLFGRPFPLVAVGEGRFVIERTDGLVDFVERNDQPTILRLDVAELRMDLTRR